MAASPITPLGIRFALSRPWGQVVAMDSASSLTDGDAGCFLVAGSHGSAMAARLIMPWAPRAVILNDAGGGIDGCGTAGLAVFQAMGVPAAAVDCFSARIGDARDMIGHGRISALNALARAAGVGPGDGVLQAMDAMAGAVLTDLRSPVTQVTGLPGLPVWLADTVSYLTRAHAGGIHIVGSHGSDVTGRHLLDLPTRAGFANDAGIGKAGAGIAGLRMLEAAGIPAAAYAHSSAVIGNARDAWDRGFLSWVNGPAAGLGLTAGLAVRAAVQRIASVGDEGAR